jgi:hypothetical protein
VAWSIRWADLARYLFDEAHLPALREFLNEVAALVADDARWVAPPEAARLYPLQFKQFAGPPAQAAAGNGDGRLVYQALVQNLKQSREAVEGVASHWWHLPWEWWLLEDDFLKGVRQMREFWPSPQANEADWLSAMLTMTQVTLQPRADATPAAAPGAPAPGDGKKDEGAEPAGQTRLPA